MPTRNPSVTLNLSDFGIDKRLFDIAWIVTTVVFAMVAYFFGPLESGMERVVAALVFMVGIGLMPYIRGFILRSKHRTATPYVFRHGRQIAYDMVRRHVQHVAKYITTLLIMTGTHWYVFDYVGMESLPPWQFATLMLVYLYGGGSLARWYFTDEDRFPQWSRIKILFRSRQ